jgi:hypothetical protein
MPPAPTPRPPPAPQRHLAPSGSGRPLPAPPPTTAQDRIRQPWSEVQRGCSVLIITCLPTLMTAAACPLGSATHDERAAVLNHCPVQSVAPHLPLLLAGRLRRLLQRGPGLRGGEGVPPTPQEQQGQAQLHQRHISHLVLAAPWWSFRRWGGGGGGAQWHGTVVRECQGGCGLEGVHGMVLPQEVIRHTQACTGGWMQQRVSGGSDCTRCCAAATPWPR